MIRPVAFLLALVVAIALRPGVAAAADGPGTKAVRAANQTIGALLRTKAKPGSDEEKRAAAAVTTAVRDFLDIDELGQRALGDHWKTLTTAQQTEYLALLRGLIEDSYVKGLRANLAYTVAYLGEAPGDGGAIVVKTTVTAKKRGRPVTIAVDYVVTATGKGKTKTLRCYDVRTDGIGLVENYRLQFAKLIKKDGFDGLLARMKKKRAGV